LRKEWSTVPPSAFSLRREKGGSASFSFLPSLPPSLPPSRSSGPGPFTVVSLERVEEGVEGGIGEMEDLIEDHEQVESEKRQQ